MDSEGRLLFMRQSVKVRLAACVLTVGVVSAVVFCTAGRSVQAAPTGGEKTASLASSAASSKTPANLKLVTDMKPYAGDCYGKTSYAIMVGDRSFPMSKMQQFTQQNQLKFMPVRKMFRRRSG